MPRPPRTTDTPDNVRAALKTALETRSLRNVASEWGINYETLRHVADGGRVTPGTLAKLEKIVDRRRTADEFKDSASRSVRAPIRTLPGTSWTLESIRTARDAQMRGQFKLASRLADSMKTDDALFDAFHKRIAPQSAVQTTLKPARDSARARAVQAKAAASCIAPRAVLAGINGTLADHGIAFGYIDQQTNKSGTRVSFRLEEWPIEFVRWNNGLQLLATQTRDGSQETINHGDGRWVVFRKFELDPWKREAAILPGSFVWAAHAFGLTDWSATAKSHAMAKLIGTLPDGNAIRGSDSELTQMAADFLRMMQELGSGEAVAGLAPFGGKVDFASNGDTNWQVFSTLITDRKKAADFIYVGTDAGLGAAGGAPGVDIAQLFGIANTKIQGDFDAIEQALNVGFYQPWTAINEGDSRYAPSLEYQLPDLDAEDKATQRRNAYKRLTDTVAEYRAQGFVVTQATIDRMARDLGVDDPPQLAPVSHAPAIVPSAADAVRALTINEVRAIIGAPPLQDARGALFITQFEETAKAAAMTAGAAAPLAPDPIPGTTQPKPVPPVAAPPPAPPAVP